MYCSVLYLLQSVVREGREYVVENVSYAFQLFSCLVLSIYSTSSVMYNHSIYS
jgi:hypothetical protein